MNLCAGLSCGRRFSPRTQSTNYNLNTYENEPLFECAGAPAQIREDRAGSAARPVVAFGAGAQDVSPARVSGTVVDQQGMPVVGAGVVVRGTQTGSVTDLDGRFTVMAAKDATLTVSFIGYTTREVP